METIGDKIRIRRLTKNYSQEYMAFMLDISQAAYSNLERNETDLTVKRIYEIAEVLEISPFEFLPKPKFGTGINHLFFWKTMKKIRSLWVKPIREKKSSSPAS